MDGSTKPAPPEMVRTVYEPGEAVYSPKDPIGRTFTVESGIIDVLSMDGGDDALIATYYRGSTFGYPDGIDHSRLPAIARAREASVVTVREGSTETPALAPRKAAVSKKAKSRDVLRRNVYYPGDKLFSEGDSGDGAFIIESGDVEVYRTEQGKEIRLGVVGPGSILGEMALIDDEPRMASARAVNQTVSVTIGRAAFENKMSNADPFIQKLLRILVRYIRLHADYFVKAQSDLHDTYLVLGLDPENPDFDKLHELSWQNEAAEKKTGEKKAREQAVSGRQINDRDDLRRQRRTSAKPRNKPA